MPTIGEYRLIHADKEYKLNLSFDDKKIMEDKAELVFKGCTRDLEDKDGPWKEVELILTWLIMDGIIEIRHGEKLIGTIRLNQLSSSDAINPDPDDPNGPVDPPDDEHAAILEQLGGQELLNKNIADIIGELPFPVDPIFGCLLKGGLSATLGQTIRCYQVHKESEAGAALAKKVFGCLGQKFWRIVGTAGWRVGRCMATGGIW